MHLLSSIIQFPLNISSSVHIIRSVVFTDLNQKPFVFSALNTVLFFWATATELKNSMWLKRLGWLSYFVSINGQNQTVALGSFWFDVTLFLTFYKILELFNVYRKHGQHKKENHSEKERWLLYLFIFSLFRVYMRLQSHLEGLLMTNVILNGCMCLSLDFSKSFTKNINCN